MKKLFFLFVLVLYGCKSIQQSNNQYYVTAYQISANPLGVEYKPPELDLYYPSLSMRENEIGLVELSLQISDSGDVVNVDIVKNSLFPRIDRAATDIARRYRFKSFDKKLPTKSTITFFVNFAKVDPSNSPQQISVSEMSTSPKSYKNKVVERLIINEQGVVESVVIVVSSGNAEVDAKAIQIGSKYTFKPFIVDGKPVRISTNLLLTFD